MESGLFCIFEKAILHTVVMEIEEGNKGFFRATCSKMETVGGKVLRLVYARFLAQFLRNFQICAMLLACLNRSID